MHCTSPVCISQMLSSSSTTSMASGLWVTVSFRPRNSAIKEKFKLEKSKRSSTCSGTRPARGLDGNQKNNQGFKELTHDLIIRAENPPPKSRNFLSLAQRQGLRRRPLLV